MTVSKSNNFAINKVNLRDFIAATCLVILLILDSNNRFSARVTLKFDGLLRKIKGHLLYIPLSFVHHLNPLREFKLELLSENAQFVSKLETFCPVWPWNLMDDLEKIGRLFYATSSFLHHFIAIGESKLKLQSGNAQFGSKLTVFSCDQAAQQMVYPSVYLSVHLSHLFHYVTLIVSSWNFQGLLLMTKVRSMQKVKIVGQRSRSERSKPNLTVSGL